MKFDLSFYFVLSVYLFLIIELFAFVKERSYLRIAMPVICYNIFGSIFGVLLFLLTRKLMLSKTI